MSEDIDYKDPELVKHVAGWAGLDWSMYTHDVSESVWVDTPDRYTDEELFQPWLETVPRWQLNRLLEAVEEAGVESGLGYNIGRYINFPIDERGGRKPLTMIDWVTMDPEIIWKAIVDTLIEAREVEWDE